MIYKLIKIYQEDLFSKHLKLKSYEKNQENQFADR